LAQSKPSPRPAVAAQAQPSDLKLLLIPDAERTEFRLGELIKLKVGYSSPSFGRYVHFGAGSPTHAYGRSFEVVCTPAEKVIDRRKVTGEVNASPMFYAGPGCGLGGALGSSCGDCDGEPAITEKPDWWFPIVLNHRVQLLEPGEYSCKAKAADVRLASTPRDMPSIFELESNPLALRVTRNDTWSKQTLAAAERGFREKSCVNPSQAAFVECAETADTIRFIGTDDSLRSATVLFNGTDGSYSQDEFWRAIAESNNQKLALTLLRERSFQPDVRVTQRLVGLIVGMSLRERSSAAFEAGADPHLYHDESLTLLREYLVDLGRSLSNKSRGALPDSRKTFEDMALATYCDKGPLLSPVEMDSILASLPRVNTQ
jgi:hypothetical protein